MKRKEKVGVIYIFTNPSFPEFVKIGYADDVEKRLKSLNSSSAVPYAFRVYATLDVDKKLQDKKVHKMIDTINPGLRSIEKIHGRIRKREFYKMTKEQAYTLFESIAQISGTEEKLYLIEATEQEIQEEEDANEVREMALNRHHFKEIEFYSSLTGKKYYTKTNDQGTLSIFEKDTDIEIPNNSNPSKKQIVLQALKDLGVDADNELTLYQLIHRLEKQISNI